MPPRPPFSPPAEKMLLLKRQEAAVKLHKSTIPPPDAARCQPEASLGGVLPAPKELEERRNTALYVLSYQKTGRLVRSPTLDPLALWPRSACTCTLYWRSKVPNSASIAPRLPTLQSQRQKTAQIHPNALSLQSLAAEAEPVRFWRLAEILRRCPRACSELPRVALCSESLAQAKGQIRHTHNPKLRPRC